ncbi:hypothetical protein AAC387_Pa03g0347 [Persea americana]
MEEGNLPVALLQPSDSRFFTPVCFLKKGVVVKGSFGLSKKCMKRICWTSIEELLVLLNSYFCSLNLEPDVTGNLFILAFENLFQRF